MGTILEVSGHFGRHLILGIASSESPRDRKTVREKPNIFHRSVGRPCFEPTIMKINAVANPIHVSAPLSYRGRQRASHSTNSKETRENIFQVRHPRRSDGRYPRFARRRTRQAGHRQVQAHGRHVQVLRQMRCEMLRQTRQKHGEKMRCQMRSKVRSQKIRQRTREGRRSAGGNAAAGLRLLATYSELAQRGAHLLGSLLAGQAPLQGRHYPENDAIDQGSGYQWFYHSHAPEDRSGSIEHGHIHLFAHRRLWARRLRSASELKFAQLADGADPWVATRHLLTIGFDAKGLPCSLFTVNSWVTGDLMLSARTTEALLEAMALDTGNVLIDRVIECVVQLCDEDIRSVLADRDQKLFSRKAPGLLQDEGLEVLSERAIDLDAKLARIQSFALDRQSSPLCR
ncbi:MULTISPECIES: DUF6969 family protein [unclassified Variovorax]|uniref:DUF6969 family protein n=1 Tax=unclassified Variovorax TaxID=663243 RepID=UPI002B22C909|nr:MULTISPECIES: hypothetical protein [unclassified Variovorax]MEB0057760.1 hypothetical protein [Variovorax sp. LG9.2]MEB0110871.1 hypothetical protein [Variovorax sp. RTB1]